MWIFPCMLDEIYNAGHVEDLGFKGLYMGAQIYINKHSSAAKVSFRAQNINLQHDAPQARRNNHAHAGT